MKRFNGFNEKGYLPYGMYNMSFEEFESIFCKNRTEKREKILKEYKKHLNEIKNTGYYLDHWIGGSFITTKDNPNDIDNLTEFDGDKVDKNNDRPKIDDLIFNSKSKTNGLCHSLRIYRYPYYDEKNYKVYLSSKLRILIGLYGNDKDEIPKGVVRLID